MNDKIYKGDLIMCAKKFFKDSSKSMIFLLARNKPATDLVQCD